jgi:hypothetical protein
MDPISRLIHFQVFHFTRGPTHTHTQTRTQVHPNTLTLTLTCKLVLVCTILSTVCVPTSALSSFFQRKVFLHLIQLYIQAWVKMVNSISSSFLFF